METKNEFAEARKIMAKNLREDKDLRFGYEANVAMLLHDQYGILGCEKRNKAAKAILFLIFES